MQLQQKHREAIAKKVGGTPDDAIVACNLIEVFSRRVRSLSGVSSARDMAPVECDITSDTDSDPDHFTMTFTSGFSIFSHTFGAALDQVSPRIIDVRLLMMDRQVRVTVARSSNAQPIKHEFSPPPVSKKRRRHVDLDFDSSRVIADSDDRTAITDIIDDVYQAFERVPASMIFWFEPVIGDRPSHMPESRGGAAMPMSDELADESVSESGAAAGGGETVGYALCFSNTPDLSHSFLHWLSQKYPTRIASLYAWMRVPNKINEAALLVVNMRRSSVSIGDSHRIVQNSQPRGIVPRVQVKRARS